MPYADNHDLPEAVQKHLPSHAQDIYREAFNNAWEQYKEPTKRRDEADREGVAHRVAWAAVKGKYTKSAAGKWEPKLNA